MIFEGTNEILRLFVTLAGVQTLGEELKKVGRALKDPISRSACCRSLPSGRSARR